MYVNLHKHNFITKHQQHNTVMRRVNDNKIIQRQHNFGALNQYSTLEEQHKDDQELQTKQ